MISPLFHATQQVLESFELSDKATADIAATLGAIDPKLPRFLASLASDLQLPIEEWRYRSVSVLLMFAATQLADDLADGDCDYLPDAAQRAPGAEWLLHQLSVAAILKSSISRTTLLASLTDLAQVGVAQAEEVGQMEWNLEKSRSAAIGLNGKQWSAYMRLLADGTPHEPQAASIGEAWGCVLHVVGDISSQDRRFSSLSTAEQTSLKEWAFGCLVEINDAKLETLRASAVWFRAVLLAG